jgi:hypothetical protein
MIPAALLAPEKQSAERKQAVRAAVECGELLLAFFKLWIYTFLFAEPTPPTEIS